VFVAVIAAGGSVSRQSQLVLSWCLRVFFKLHGDDAVSGMSWSIDAALDWILTDLDHSALHQQQVCYINTLLQPVSVKLLAFRQSLLPSLEQFRFSAGCQFLSHLLMAMPVNE